MTVLHRPTQRRSNFSTGLCSPSRGHRPLVDLCPPIEPYQVTKNLIELVWHSAKEYIANREFENKEELEKVVNTYHFILEKTV